MPDYAQANKQLPDDREEGSPEPPYPGKPPFDLVQLHTLPVSLWRGRPVFHPGSQQGDEARWREEDDPFFRAEPTVLEDGTFVPGDTPGTAYDLGVVVHWEEKSWRQARNPEVYEVYFLTGHGFTLHYPAGNLWTPRLKSDLELLALTGEEK